MLGEGRVLSASYWREFPSHTTPNFHTTTFQRLLRRNFTFESGSIKIQQYVLIPSNHINFCFTDLNVPIILSWAWQFCICRENCNFSIYWMSHYKECYIRLIMSILIGSSETPQFFEYLIASIPAALSLDCIFFAVKDIRNNPACEYFEWLKPDPAKPQGEILRWDRIDQVVFSLQHNIIFASNAVVDLF